MARRLMSRTSTGTMKKAVLPWTTKTELDGLKAGRIIKITGEPGSFKIHSFRTFKAKDKPDEVVCYPATKNEGGCRTFFTDRIVKPGVRKTPKPKADGEVTKGEARSASSLLIPDRCNEIRETREALGLSRREMSDLTSLPISRIHNVEMKREPTEGEDEAIRAAFAKHGWVED